MAPLERQGVSMLAEGADKFIADLKRVGIAYDENSKRFRDIKTGRFATFDKAQKSIQGTTAATGDLTSALTGAGAAAGGMSMGAVAAGTALGGLAVMAVKVVADVGTKMVEALLNAARALGTLAAEGARVDGFRIGFEYFSSSVVAGSDAMAAALVRGSDRMIATNKLFRRFNEAASLVSRDFAEKLPEALQYLGKVSLTTGRSLDYLLESFALGVGRLQPKIIDNLNVQVTLAEAIKRASAETGKAADQLSILDKQAGITALTLEKLEKNTAGIPDVTDTAATKMAQFGASLENIRVTLSEYLQPAFTTILDIGVKFLWWLEDAIKEGGALYPVLIRLGTAWSFFADGLQAGSNMIMEFVDNLTTDLGNGVAGIATSAFDWGVDIVVQLADGLVSATNTVLTAAMNAISGALSYWLSPGSPPRVAPQLDKWGVNYMTTLLHGMTQADFGVLSKVKGHLKSLLSPEELGKASKGLIGALSTGNVSDVTKVIQAVGGQFAPELNKLAMVQLKVAAATDAMAAADARLAAQQAKLTKSQGKIKDLTEEYNTLLRSGASRDVLDQKLAEINAEEKRSDTIAASITKEEAAAKGQKEKLAGLKEEASLQDALVKELLALNKALTPKEIKAGAGVKGVKGKAGVTPEVAAVFEFPKIDLAGKIGRAIEDMKQSIRDKLKGSLSPFTKLKEKIEELIEDLKPKLVEFGTILAAAWTTAKEDSPFLQDLEDGLANIPDKVQDVIDIFGDMITLAWEPVKKFWDTALQPMFVAIGKVIDALVETTLEDLHTTWLKILEKMQELWDFIGPFIAPWEGSLKTVMDVFTKQVLEPLNTGFATLGGWVQNVTGWLETLADMISNRDWSGIDPFVGESPSPLEKGLRGITRALADMHMERQPLFNGSSFAGNGGTTVYDNREVHAPIGPVNNPGMGPAQLQNYVRRTIRQEFA